MDYNSITNAVAREAIRSWQQGDAKKWKSHFAKDAKLYDDGNPRDLVDFSTNVIGTEYFLSFDKIVNGTDIYGHFHTEKWGNFNAYFKFQVNVQGEIIRLDIGMIK